MWIGNVREDLCRSDVAEVVNALRENWLAIGLWVGLCLGAGVAFLQTARPQFVATTQLVLEQPAVAADGLDVLRFVHQLTLDNAQAQTQLHIILSERLLRSVFDALALAQAPELAPSSDTAFDRLTDWFRLPQAGEEIVTEAGRAFARFRDRVRARRIGLSYAIEISYWAEDAAEAARVANAVAAAYARDRLESAASDAAVGFAPVKRRIERIASEQRLAAASVGVGAVPDDYFPDAAVRLLGMAAVPGGKTFPRAGPLLGLALCFGLVSAGLAVAGLRPMSRRARLRRGLRMRFGLDCLDDQPVSAGSRSGRSDAVGGRVLPALRARLAARGCFAQDARIGILAAAGGTAQTRIASGLTALMATARCPARLVDVTVGDTDAVGDAPIARSPGADADGPADATTTVFAMPPLARSADARALLSSLDAAILVVETRRDTMDDIRATLALMSAAEVPVAGAVLAG